MTKEELFSSLLRTWKKETLYLSSMTAMCRHPAYRQIITMGPEAVPLIIEELRREPHWLFDALREITGADPVRHEDKGRLDRMTEVWLNWARENL